MAKGKLPGRFQEYFWDVDFNSLTLENARTLILKRVLDRGSTEDILWLKKNYTFKEIEKLLLSTRDLSQKSANFWADILNINHKKVPCLLKPYSPIQFGLYS